MSLRYSNVTSASVSLLALPWASLGPGTAQGHFFSQEAIFRVLHLYCFYKPYILTRSVCVIKEMCSCVCHPGKGDTVPTGAAWAGRPLLWLCQGGFAHSISAVQAAVTSGCESGQCGIFQVGPSFPSPSGRFQGCVLKNCMELAPGLWPLQYPGLNGVSLGPVWLGGSEEAMARGRFMVLWRQTACLRIMPMPLTSSVTLNTLCT